MQLQEDWDGVDCREWIGKNLEGEGDQIFFNQLLLHWPGETVKARENSARTICNPVEVQTGGVWGTEI
jgi:hypothetical protein